MTVTDVRMRILNDETKMKAVVSIVLDNEFAVHDIKIIKGIKGLFIAMPSRKNHATDEFQDTAHPITKLFRETLQDAILQKYYTEVANAEHETV